MAMRWIVPGEFMLGSPANEASRGTDEGPQTRVTLTRGYWIGQTEVTQAQWRAVMGTDPSRFRGEALPVEQVSWFDAMAFGRRLTEVERAAGRLPAGHVYTLPTEAQWEFAAKAGLSGAFSRPVDDFAWHDQNTQQTQAVGTKWPNAWGFFDTLGNVWEWCYDWYAAYPGGAVQDPVGPPSGSAKASRGGSWWAGPRGARPANRYRDMPHNGNDDLGFRVALVAELPGAAMVALAGTDSMGPMVQRWIAAFRLRHPEISLRFETGAPPTAAAGLAAGTATIAYTGRSLWASELASIAKTQGAAPRSIRIGAGAYNDVGKTHTMAVFVHARNPLRELSLDQLRQVFAVAAPGLTWRQLGLGGEWASRPVHSMAAKLGTGATNSVREAALQGLPWSGAVKAFPSDEAVVAAVAQDHLAMGIAGLPYTQAWPGGGEPVRVLALAATNGASAFEPTRDNVAMRRYPLARLLYFHVFDSREQPLPGPARRFIEFVLSDVGQTIVGEAGYLPLTDDILQEELAKLAVQN